MWDVSSAGPLTGAAVSALLLGAGLWQSVGGDAHGVTPEMLVRARVHMCHRNSPRQSRQFFYEIVLPP